jgi:glutamyl-tRNA reductase
VAGSDGVAYSLEQLPAALSQMDVVITATASPQPIISAAMVAAVVAGREERPFVLIDIAVPRDVDPAVRDAPGVHLFDVDDLQGTLDSALAARRREVPRVETIIHQEISCLRAELQELAIKPLIVDLRRKAEAIRRRELKRTMRYLDDVDAETMEHIQHLSRSLVNKLLHDPTIRLKAKASNGHAANYAAAVRDLFALETTTTGSNQ